MEWAKARVGYYNFKGEFGDEDEDGLRAGLDLSPGEGVVFGVEYDGEDGTFGGNISYTHTFGETQQESQRAGEFDPRAHFYDAVRREYSQRISRAESGGGNNAVIVNSGVSVGVFGDVVFGTATATVVAPSVNINFAFPLTGAMVMVSTHTTPNTGTLAMNHGGGWSLDLAANSEVAFLQGTTLSVTRGSGTFERGGSNLRTVLMGNDTIGLLGTRFDFRVDDGNAYITLHDGGLSVSAGANISVEVLDTPGTFVQVGSVTVGCGGTLRADNVSGKCGIARGATMAVPGNGIVNEGEAETAVGRFVPAGSAAGVMATTDTPGFTVRAVNNGFNLFILMTTAARANPNTIMARMLISADLQTPSVVVFPVLVNPSDITVGFAGGFTTFAPTGSENIIVGTLGVGGGYQADNIAVVQSQNGGFALTDGTVLVASADTARTVTVTVRGDDNNRNTPAAHLPVSMTVYDELRFAPANLLAESQRGMVTAHIPKTLGTLGASGGFGNYAFTSNNAQASLVDMSVMVLHFTTAATTTLRYVTDDRNADNSPAPATSPLTFFVTATASNPLVISANVAVSYLNGVSRWQASVQQHRMRLTLDMDALMPPRMVTLTINMPAKVAADNDGVNANAVRMNVFRIGNTPTNVPNNIPPVNVQEYIISVYENNVLTIRDGS